MEDKTTIKIDDIEYVRKDSIKNSIPAEKLNGMEYKIVRGDRSGVFAGYIASRNGREVEMINARRLWYWDGAASLSELAQRGVSKPQNCKFPCKISKVLILDAIEILDVSSKSKDSIESVIEWTK